MPPKKFNWLKLGGIFVAGPYCFWYASDQPSWHFIDNFDLMVHEAGHPVFFTLGQFMGVLGGSLMQCLVPTVLLGYFWKRRAYYSACIMGFWVGINLVNVSVYAGDARKMELPLFNFDPDSDANAVGHDWNWLLTHTHLLAHTDQVAGAIYGAGLGIFLVCIFFGVKYSREDAAGAAGPAPRSPEALELEAMMKGSSGG